MATEGSNSSSEPPPPASPYHRRSRSFDYDDDDDNEKAPTKKPSTPSRKVSNISMPEEKSGLFGAASNMVNSIVGAGIIGIPYAISNAGFVVGVALLVLVAFLTDKSLRMIVELASFHPKLRHLGVCTYEDLARIPFGKVGAGLVMAGMFVLGYGAMVAYLLIIKDTVPTVMGLTHEAGKGNFWEAEFPMFVTSLLIVVPLSMMRDMASLEKTSMLSVLADLVLVGFVVFFSPVQSTVADAGGLGEVLLDNWANKRLFIGLGVLSTAMACQHSAFIVSNSLADRTPHRWSLVTSRSITIAAICCLLMGIFGYLGFLGETQGDILNNFEAGSLAANTGRILLAFTMFFTYPMEAFVVRHVLVAVLYDGDMDGDTTTGPKGETVVVPKFLGIFGRRHKVTFAIYLATLLPALLVDDLGPVLSLTGAVGASFISFICTGLVYLGINGDEFLEYCGDLLKGDRDYSKVDVKTPRHNASELELPRVDQSTKTDPSDVDKGERALDFQKPAPEIPSGLKPWWWYLGGFPIWTAIAARGAAGTRQFLQEFTGEEDGGATSYDSNDSQVLGPSERDYYVSMFMISFGTLAAVVGVASNVYVQIQEMLDAP